MVKNYEMCENFNQIWVYIYQMCEIIIKCVIDQIKYDFVLISNMISFKSDFTLEYANALT